MRLKDVIRPACRLVVAALLLAGGLALSPPRPAIAAPPSLPADRLHFGLSNFDASWLTASGVPWRYRYTYIAGGVCWSGSAPGCADWTTWQDPALPPGQYPIDYINNTPSGTIPVFPYYMLLQSHRAADEATDDYDNLNNPSLMSSYYANFRLLLQRVNSTGRQAVIHVEPDLWGYLQQRSDNFNGDGTADQISASVASSGLADVANYPNTAQGFGEALLHLRDLYAPNTVVMAVHASMWSSKIDVGSTIGSVDPAGEAAKTARFLSSTGNWDAVFNDLDDHDAGWWEKQGADNQWFTHWWNPTITDATASYPNFPRYLAWVSTLRSQTGKPQMAWQVPEGNQYFLTMNNTCGHYQDDVAEYFLGHPAALYSAGLIAVLFGAGNSCQTTNEDTQKDGTTNNGGQPTLDAATTAWCSGCNTNASQYADDDGGYLRIFVGRYYASPQPRHIAPEPPLLYTPVSPPAMQATPALTQRTSTTAGISSPGVSSSGPPERVPQAAASRQARVPYDPSRLIRGQPL